jgi:hypothetical protein
MIFKHYSNLSVDHIANEYYTSRIDNNKLNPKIYDISHKLLPNLYNYEMISNLVTTLFILPLGFNIPLLYEFLGFIIPLLIIRSITTHLTILPKTKHCDVNNSSPFFGGCYDKIFSGHFSVVFLATLLYKKYNLIDDFSLLSINLINSFFILFTRAHYTIDIVVAFFVTLFVYQNNISITTIF